MKKMEAGREERLRELWPHYSQREIRKMTGLSKGAIAGTARRLELAGNSLGENCSRIGRPKREFSQAEIQEIRERLAGGQSEMATAKGLKTSLKTVHACMRENGIERPIPKRRIGGYTTIQPVGLAQGGRPPEGHQAVTQAVQKTARPMAAANPAGPPAAALDLDLRPSSVCQWPTGDKGNFRFLCDQAAIPERPYCEDHCCIGYLNWPRGTR